MQALLDAGADRTICKYQVLEITVAWRAVVTSTVC
jgi:hypothetical protein